MSSARDEEEEHTGIIDEAWKTAHGQSEVFKFDQSKIRYPRFTANSAKKRERQKLDFRNKAAAIAFIGDVPYASNQTDDSVTLEFYTSVKTSEPQFGFIRTTSSRYIWQIDPPLAELAAGGLSSLTLEQAKTFVQILETSPARWRPINVYHINSPHCVMTVEKIDKPGLLELHQLEKEGNEKKAVKKRKIAPAPASHLSQSQGIIEIHDDKNDDRDTQQQKFSTRTSELESATQATKIEATPLSTDLVLLPSYEGEDDHTTSSTFEKRISLLKNHTSQPETVAARGDDYVKRYGSFAGEALRITQRYVQNKLAEEEKDELTKARETIQRQAQTIKDLEEADSEIQLLLSKRASKLSRDNII